MTQRHASTIDHILDQIPGGIAATESRDLIRRAYDFAACEHQGQWRRSGEPYIQHPLHVAYLLAEMQFEPAVIAAGLLHDVLEDCEVTRQQLREQFGDEVLVLVEGVTKLEGVEKRFKQDQERVHDLQELESLRKLLVAMAEDHIGVIFIKLADRLHNMRTLDALPPKNQQRMARETLEIFALMANRLGIWRWKAELQDLSFRYLNAEMSQNLADLLDARREERQARVEQHIKRLRLALEESGIHAQIEGRPKHIYSIYRKMRRKNIPFSRIYDTEGLRVIVDTEAQCYQALGLVHHLWTPVPGEFDDYIAHPKPNGYQSLHTAVIGDGGGAFEIQIRTYQMNYVAEYGVAAHWLYKEQEGAPVSERMQEQIAQVRQSVHEITQDARDTRSFIDSIRSDVFEDRVYVFTPRGQIIDLPMGATPIDFAYHVHTEVGHSCRGARVNGRWTSLSYQLQTGDQVEVVTGRVPSPGRDWLNEELGYVKTSRARQKIRQWFRRQGREENIARGRTIVERELKRLGLAPQLGVEDVAELFERHYQRSENFFAAVGIGDMSGDGIADRLETYMRRRAEEEAKLPEPEETTSPPPPPPPEITGEIEIMGTGGLLTKIARCCNPLPGEEIVGFVTRGRGVTVHRQDCPNILSLSSDNRERLIEVEWGMSKEETFPVQVQITVYDRARLLHDISGVMSDEDINMTSLKTGTRDRFNVLPIYITMEVANLAKLNRVLGKIEQLRNVINAHRLVQ
jgi:GTP diphosphokinase / guanosine-3',5'-bis(diphosphate) 3'-diphosphatase